MDHEHKCVVCGVKELCYLEDCSVSDADRCPAHLFDLIGSERQSIVVILEDFESNPELNAPDFDIRKKETSIKSLLIGPKLQELDSLSRGRSEAGLKDLLVYGPTGSMKTPFLATAHGVKELTPAFCVDLENGAHALIANGIEVQSIHEYLELITKRDKRNYSLWDACVKIINDLSTIIDECVKQKKNIEEFPFKCLIFEGWTELYDICYEQVVRESKQKNNSADGEVGTQGDRLRTIGRIKIFTRKLRSIPVHILSSAREYEFKDKNGTPTGVVIPHMSEGAAKFVAAQIDIITRHKIIGGKVRAYYAPTSGVVARDRYFKLPENIENPTLEKVWSYLRGDKDKDKK